MSHALLLLSTLAFAGDVAPEPDAAWGRVINGEEVRGDAFPSAVAIGFDASAFSRGSRQAYQATCSASLITTRMLLTAAHCTAEYERQGIPLEGVLEYGAAFFGLDVNSGEVDAVGFADIINHPKYGGQNNPENDIGVIILDEDVDVKPTWFQVGEITEKQAVGKTVTSVGYGSDSYYNGPGSGVKRRVQLVIDQVDEQFLRTFAATNPTQGNVCSGDSGGPQYRRRKDGTLVQWGVHSNVFGGSSAATICNAASSSTNVGTFSDWVLRHIEDEHGTTDRCTLQRSYGDRVCDLDCVDPDVDCELDVDEDGLVSDEEFERVDFDANGLVDDEEIERFRRGCSHTGGAPAGLALLGLVGLALRRRR
ncbi:MAG: trypsin-like serine protease [Alphaproteobacteria bacterium]|nr:trypsin-like serine protease [Alphaproteobacteria bacterium]